MSLFISLLLLVVVASMNVGGDYLIKVSVSHRAGMLSLFFLSGAALYGISAIGWFYMMRSHSLTWIAVSYSSATLIMLALLGVVVFGETLRFRDILAVAMGLSAIVLVSQ